MEFRTSDGTASRARPDPAAPAGMRFLRPLLAALLLPAAPPGATATNTPAMTTPLPPAADLRPLLDRWGLPPRSQGDRPTCSALVVAGALEFAEAQRRGRGTRLSPEFLNWAANRATGGAQDGAFFADLWKGFARYGICAETGMPYRAAFDPHAVPDAAALADARVRRAAGPEPRWIKEWDPNCGLTGDQFAQLKRTLADGRPVCGGLRWPIRERWVDDVLQMCPADAVFDGHSVLFVGYRDDPAQPGGGFLLFRNTGHGARDGRMPYAFALAYLNDALWLAAPPERP